MSSVSTIANNIAIAADDLTIGYGHTVVQQHLSFSLHRGEMVALLGRNGCGKSTLMRTLVGMQPALAGTITMEDGMTPAVVLTEHDTLDHTTVHDIVAMGRYPYTSFLGGLSTEDEQIITDSLRQVGLSAFPLEGGSRGVSSLSSGQQQRVLIAKALAQQTDTILLDEPTSHLDIPGKQEIFAMLRRLATEQGKTILICTHEQELALRYSDRILMMYSHGGGIALTSPSDFRPEW